MRALPFAAALDLLLPARCAGCHDVDDARPTSRGLCADCARAIEDAQPVASQLQTGSQVLPVFAAATYDGVVRSALLEYKEHARLCLRRELGCCLSASVLAVLAVAMGSAGGSRPKAPALVVPVPSTRAARRARGHDPVGALARVAARHATALGAALDVARVLRQTRDVADQSGLDSAGRRANLMGALEVRPGAALGGRETVLVDDIVTTGATAIEAVRALNAVGANVLGVACVAATPRRYPARAVTSGRRHPQGEGSDVASRLRDGARPG